MKLNSQLSRAERLELLKTEDPEVLKELYDAADSVRREHVGDEVHLRGLIELSNHCRRRCLYCGVRADRKITRYRLTKDEILACVDKIVELGYGSVVMQAGEDPEITPDFVVDLIHAIRARSNLAITLSLGEQSYDTLKKWRDAGADRYLLRFETTSPDLFRRLHPACPGHDRVRMEQLREMIELGYQVGTGALIGVPGQTFDDLNLALEWLRDLPAHMIGSGPYIPHMETPLGQHPEDFMAPADVQVPATAEMTWRFLALARLMVPDAMIPATTALAVVNEEQGRELALQRGANVVMPNVTTPEKRSLYEIYPAKGRTEAALEEGVERSFDIRLKQTLARMGRPVGQGRGDALRRA